jgi:hypothetical protein
MSAEINALVVVTERFGANFNFITPLLRITALRRHMTLKLDFQKKLLCCQACVTIQ